MGDIPFFAIGNEELDKLPNINMSEPKRCPECRKPLMPEYGTTGGMENRNLAFITCDECKKSWVVAVRGKELPELGL